MPKRKSKTRRTNNDPYKDHFFVVYKQKVGRIDKGVYMRKVTFDGKIAFVHPRDGAANAQIVPASHVFKKKDQANAFFSSDAELKWIAYKSDEGIPEVVQARVSSYIIHRHRGWGSEVRVISRADGTAIDTRSGLRGYSTEREAYRHYFTNMEKYLKEVNEEIATRQARKDGLLKIQRKIKALGITRGLKEDD